MKKLYYFLIIGVFISSLGFCQEGKKYFFDDVKYLNLPVVVDDFNFSEIDNYTPVRYGDVSGLLKNEDNSFSLILPNNESIIYVYGKFDYHDCLAVILFFKNEETNTPTCFLNLYDKNQKLVSFECIAWRTELESKSAVVYPNRIVGKLSPENTTEYMVYKQMDGFFPFYRLDCEESDCIDFNRKTDVIPQREMKTLSFGKVFFEQNLNLIPLKFCSPQADLAELPGMDEVRLLNGCFIDSKVLADKRIIVFYLSAYNSVKEVGYLLFDENMVLLGGKQIASSFIDNNGEVTLQEATVIEGNGLLAISLKGQKSAGITFKLN
ncbi:hypothetical protein [Flavobacterium sp. C4GT6]|uniref:hypothetical protein n=1 Tax=Flavobacterium sp. C4GT6 TaxID=3103818 RepID=UPI002ED38F47